MDDERAGHAWPERLRRASIERRCFLGVTGAAGLLAAALLEPEREGTRLTTPPVLSAGEGPAEAPPLRTPGYPPAPPFSLGVASGDPTPGGFVLWTRLAPDPLVPGGGMPPGDVGVQWQVASDERMTRLAASGTAVAGPAAAHSVHVQVSGLAPDRWWFYRFRARQPGAGWVTSPVGRTRTLPAAGASPGRLRFAFASCQDWQAGYYPAWAHLAAEDLDLVVHLGDYIYENGRRAIRAVRRHEGPEARTLDGYRARYGLYKSDPALQAAHRAFPFVATWDDHEVANNYAGLEAADPGDQEGFAARRAAAWQAWYEHLPVAASARPSRDRVALARRVAWGRLATFHVLDTRTHRTGQPCGGDLERRCAAATDRAATMLGRAQERWLLDGLDRSAAAWNVLAQGVVMAPIRVASLLGDLFNMDQWDGYVAARRRLLDFVAARQPANPVVISGDVHSTWINDLHRNPDDPTSPLVATELVGTSISSSPPRALIGSEPVVRAANPHVRWVDAAKRGYLRCELTPDAWRTDVRVVDTVRRPTAKVATAASFVVESGRPGATIA